MLTQSLILNDSISSNGKCDYVVYNKANPFSTIPFHETRDTTERVINIPHIIDDKGQLVGVFDQSFTFLTNYDKPYTLTIRQGVYNGSSVLYMKELFQQTIMSGTRRLFFTPYDVTDFQGETGEPHAFYTIEELKHPSPLFVVIIKFDEAPTVGELTLAITRRF